MGRTVEDVMTRDVVVAREDMPFKDVARLMWAAGVTALPVVSEADLVLKEELAAGGEPRVVRLRRRADRAKAAATVARDVMTAPAVVIGPGATAGQAARLMHAKGVKRLPVVDPAGRLIGIVGRADLLRIFLRPDDLIRREVEHDVVERTLWLTPKEAGVRVEVADGIVTLSGEVDRKSVARILAGLTAGIDGVVGIEDRLTYRIDDDRARGNGARSPDVLPEALRWP